MDLPFSSDAGSDGELDQDQHVLKKTSQSLGLTRNYVTSWTARDAFREFFQNWMDGIISAERIPRENIKVVITDSSNEWIATAHRPDSREVLGFIRHTKVGRSQGMLELTNFKAQLTRKSLELGVSSKRNENNTAGTHGEGYKIAALVMTRKGYQVRYESSKFYWTFRFGGRQKSTLYCKLTPMADSKVSKYMMDDAKLKAQGEPRKLIGNIWEDVTVKIGRVYSPLGKEVDFEEFKAWIKIAFALDQPSEIIKTQYGDLILDRNYTGRMYLKGLFLGDCSTFKNLKFGYNLADGIINRDRQRLTTNGEEATSLANIWAESISKEPGRTVNEYIKMLKDDDGRQWADVNMAKNRISKQTAAAIWQHLQEEGASRDVFYCDKKFAAKQSRDVRKYLQKRPEILPDCIWEPLRKYGLVKTPEEYAHHLLHSAAIAEVEHNPYSNGVKRALSAILALDERTKHLTMVFKSGANAKLDLFLEENNLLINDKWLDFEKSHDIAPCWLSHSLSQTGAKVPQFPCDHIVTGLYGLILREIQKDILSVNETGQDVAQTLRMRVGESLQQMPRLVEIAQGSQPGQLIVNWTILEGDMVWKLYGVDLECRVILHRESTCSDKKTDLLFTLGAPENLKSASSKDGSSEKHERTGECGCSYEISSQQDSKVVFQDLNAEEKYFPMVAREYDQAFFGVPPEAIGPAGADNNTASLASSNSSAHSGSADSSKNGIKNSSDGLSSAASENKVEKKSIGNVSGNDASQGSQTSENEKTPSAQEQQAKAKSRLLNSASEQLQFNQQLMSFTAQKLQIKEQELATALEALEIKQLELRQAKAQNDAQKQSFESTIEDLQSEVQQLQETQSENETQCAELSGTIENLRTEVQKLRQEKTEMESQARHPVDVEMTGVGQNTQGAADRVNGGGTAVAAVEQTSNGSQEAAGESVFGMREQVEELRRQVDQARADQASIVTTLQGVSGMIQGVINLGSRATMISTLQGVLGMIQGVLSLGIRLPTHLAGTKHPRIKQEESDDDGLINASKRLKQGECIDLTE